MFRSWTTDTGHKDSREGNVRIHPTAETKKGHRIAMTFLSGGSRIRTGDPMLAKHVLYQLSYTPKIKAGLVAGFGSRISPLTGRPWQS